MTDVVDNQEPSVIDFDTLLAPIPGDFPGGVDLREDSKQSSKFYAVRDARKAEIDNDRMRQRFAAMKPDELEYELGLLQSDPRRVPKWSNVVNLSTRLITESSKDLWVAAWLVEALVREHGIAGLRDGLKLCRLLCQNFWDHVQPRPNEDEGGWEWTLAQLDGLNVTIKNCIQLTPLFRKELIAPRERDLSPLAFKEAELLERLDPSTRNAKISEGKTTLEDFRFVVSRASTEELVSRAATIAAARNELRDYYQAFSDLGCDFSPSVSGIESELEAFESLFNRLAKDKMGSADVGESTENNSSVPIAMMGGSMGTGRSDSPGVKGVMTREDALQGLLRVADFFRRTEPHSPVSYALEQAVRWGRMPLPDLLRDLVSEDAVRESVFRRLGIPESDNNDNSYNSDEDDS
jgi:type VI secretion system protein ImpA